MKKFLGILCLILGLILLISSIINIIKPFTNENVTAYADKVDMPEDTYTLNVDKDNLVFSAVSPFSWALTSGETMPPFVLYCFNDVFVLGTSTISLIGNELQLIQYFDLSTSFETTVEVEGWYDDYVTTGEVFVSSSFTEAEDDEDYVRFTVYDRNQRIEINIKSLNRYFAIDIYCYDGQFAPLDSSTGVYTYILSYYDLNTLFQNGYVEGEQAGYNNGYDQGYDIGYREGYDVGVMTGFDGDLFGGSIVPSVNSLFGIELLPGVSFYTIFSIGFGLIMLGIAIKVFLGG